MGNNKRKMPHSNDLKTNGKFDLEKFKALAPAAREAQATGETRLHEIIIRADKNGKVSVRAKRSHDGKAGMDPRIATALNDLLVMLVATNVVAIADMNEGPSGEGRDELVILGA